MKVRKAVFPAAGLGTRFLPATKAQPKEMLPLVDKPTIQYVVEEAVASGLEEIILVTGRNKRAIEDHFDAAFELEYYLQDRGKLEELAQIKTISELATRLLRAPEGAARPRPRDPLRAVDGGRRAVRRVPGRRHHRVAGAVHAPAHRRVRAPRRPGAGGDAHAAGGDRPLRRHRGRAASGPTSTRSQDLVEKPDPRDAPSDLAIIGRYVLTPDLFSILKETAPDSRGEIQLTNGLRVLRGRRPIYAVEFEGKRHDTGEKLGFLKATVEFALARPDLSDAFREYLKSLDL